MVFRLRNFLSHTVKYITQSLGQVTEMCESGVLSELAKSTIGGSGVDPPSDTPFQL